MKLSLSKGAHALNSGSIAGPSMRNGKGEVDRHRACSYSVVMPTPTAVEPPTPENIHLYRAAALAWRKAEIEERSRHKDVRLANPHFANHAAALAVHALAPEMTFEQAFALARQATNWAARAHHKWFWSGIPGNGFGV